MRGLKDKVVIVTGGGGGIGSAICRRFGAEGAVVAIFDLNVAAAEKVAAEIKAADGRAQAYAVDITEHEGVHAEIMETGGNPVVYGEIAGERDDVTVVLYNHYDVKPVEPLEAWHSEPFHPLLRRGRVEDGAPSVPEWRALSDAELRSCLVYARGSGDDKGPLHGNLMALRTMRAVAGKPPCRIKFLYDGEEEIGSPNVPAFLRQHRERFRGDVPERGRREG